MTKKKIFSKNIIKYIEAIIYILAIIVGIFACNSGPIYIKMLPILFILGFVGRIIFDRPDNYLWNCYSYMHYTCNK